MKVISSVDLLSCWQQAGYTLKFVRSGALPPIITGEMLCPPEAFGDKLYKDGVLRQTWKKVSYGPLKLYLESIPLDERMSFHSALAEYAKWVRDYNELCGEYSPSDYKVTVYFRTLPEIINNVVTTVFGLYRELKKGMVDEKI